MLCLFRSGLSPDHGRRAQSAMSDNHRAVVRKGHAFSVLQVVGKGKDQYDDQDDD